MKALGKAAIICTILFLVFAILGTVLTAIGIGEIAKNEDFGTAVHAFVDNLDVDDYTHFSIGNGSGEFVTIGADEAQELCVSASDALETIKFERLVGNVDIVKGNTEELRLSYTGSFPKELYEKLDMVSTSGDNSPLFDTNVTDDTVKVSINYGKDKWELADFRNGKWRSDLLITLPKSFDGTLVIEEAASDLDMHGLTLAGLTLKEIAAEVDGENCSIMFLTIEDATSDVDIDGTVGGVSIINCMSSIDITSAKPFAKTSTIENCMGNVEIELPLSAKVRLDVQNSLGNVRVAEPLRNNSGTLLSVENCMGNITVEAND